jgi:hypothetical protein
VSTEPFSDSSTATSDASGNITFTNFQSPPTRIGYWRQGTFSVVRSDGGVVVSTSVLPITWKAFVGPTIWGTWYNDQPSNMVQTNGPPVKVTGSNLAASTAYQCVFTGYDSDAPPPLSPLPAPAPPPSGFTTLVAGINNVATITGNQYLNAVGAPVNSPVWFPVVVGTALEIAYMGATFANLRLTPLWATAANTANIIHNEDTFDLSFVVPNSLMAGLIYLNHAPFVAFQVQGVGCAPAIQINTGLPPVFHEPTVPQSQILTASGTLAGNAATALLPFKPYIGQAMFSAQIQNASGTVGQHGFYFVFSGTDYTGAPTITWGQATNDYITDNTGAQIAIVQPRIILVPPLINGLSIVSQNPNTVSYLATITAVGP